MSECQDNCPDWFDAPNWRDWHRGHGCNKDDGNKRSPRGAACINRRRGLVKSTSEPLRPGDRVVYRGGENPEYGIVIHVWHNEEIDCEDAYVAFFGDDFPTGKKPAKPYVLRYFTSSLERA